MIREVIRIKKSEESSEQAAMLAMILAKKDYTARIEQVEDEAPEGYLDVVFWKAE